MLSLHNALGLVSTMGDGEKYAVNGIFVLFFFFEVWSLCVALVILEFTMYQALNSRDPACLCFKNPGIEGTALPFYFLRDKFTMNWSCGVKTFVHKDLSVFLLY